MSRQRLDILCLCTPHKVGGAQGVASTLTSAFRDRGYSCDIGFLFDSDPNYCCGVDGAFVISKSAPKGIISWVAFIYRCVQLISLRNPRYILGFHPFANIIGALFAGWRGSFFSTQAWPAFGQSKSTELVEHLLTHSPLVTGNIAVSNFVASTFKHRGAAYRRKTSVIYNSPPVLCPINEDAAACRSHFGMPHSSLVLGVLGRLHEQKNFKLAVQALSHIPDAQLYIAGSGPQEGFLRDLARELDVADQVHFTGEIRGSDVPKFLKSVDLLLMTSIYEGHPLVMLEAMTLGVPVVAHDIPVLREAGGDAAVYASSAPEDWATVIGALGLAERLDLAQRGVQRARSFAQVPMEDRYLEAMGLPANRLPS